MAIKWTIVGMLIYLAMAGWAVSFALYVAGGFARRDGRSRVWLGRLGEVLFAFGGVVLAGGFICRWLEVGHVPLQSKFEVFMSLGVLMYPLWLFCNRVLGARGPALNVLIGMAVVFPAGFVFQAQPQVLPPALQSWLFLPHVGLYMLAYVVLTMAGAQAALQIVDQCLGRAEAACEDELATWRIVRLGLPMLIGGLALGALWGKLAWGDYWNWDPKELWSLATFLVYVSYLHVRGLQGGRHGWVNSVLALAGVVCILITLLIVTMGRLFPGLHSYAS